VINRDISKRIETQLNSLRHLGAWSLEVEGAAVTGLSGLEEPAKTAASDISAPPWLVPCLSARSARPWTAMRVTTNTQFTQRAAQRSNCSLLNCETRPQPSCMANSG